MPPPAGSEQNPGVVRQLQELSSAVSQLAQLAHANNQYHRRIGESAERFGRTIDEARQNLHREFRDLVVAVHFTAESLERHAKSVGRVQGPGGRFAPPGGLSPRDAALKDVRQRFKDLRQEAGDRFRLQNDLLAGDAARLRSQKARGLVTPAQFQQEQALLDQHRFKLSRDRDRQDRRLRARERTERQAAGRLSGSLAGPSRLATAAPAVGALAAAAMVGATALKSFYDVLAVSVQAASPNVWRTFTGNFEILIAKVGTSVVPAFIRLAGAAEELADRWERIPKPVRDHGVEVVIRSVLAAFGATGAGIAELMFGSGGGPNKKDLNTNEPRFSAVESVWENMALGFIRENDIQRELLKTNQEQLQVLQEINGQADRMKKPGK